MRTTRSIVAVMGVALATACGGSSSDSGGGSNVPMSELPAKLAQAFCDDVKACTGELYPLLTGGEDCVQLYTTRVEQGDFSLLQAAIDAKRITYHPDKVDGCLAALSGLGCGIGGQRFPSACDDVFQGTVADGGTCTLNEECTGESVCIIDTVCPGKCAPRSAQGGKCDSDDDCQNGLACDESSYTCVPIPGAGDACSTGGAGCALGSACVGTSGAQTCKSYADAFTAAVGASCDVTTGTFCVASARCEIDSTGAAPTQTCVQPVASGGACKAAAPDECPTGEYCKIAPNAATGTCTALPAAGAPCGTSPLGASVCATDAACDATTKNCVALQKDGASCSDDSICYSGHCESKVCKASMCAD